MNRELLSDALGGIDERHIAEASAARPRKTFRLRRVAAVALAAALCLMLALPVLASADGSYELLYTVAPALAQRLKPVQLTCEDNGIQMEVVAASVEGDTAEAYIALRDLEGDSTGTCRRATASTARPTSSTAGASIRPSTARVPVRWKAMTRTRIPPCSTSS